MYYTIYKTTNKINQKIYIGCHQTNDINDDYLGSGKILKRAIDKYGIENFTKEILAAFNNPEEMFEMEAKLVNNDFIKENKNYNLKVGGEGGWGYLNDGSKKHIDRVSTGAKFIPTEESKQKTSKSVKKLFENKEHYEKVKYQLLQSRMSFAGKNHTAEAKRRIGEANKKHQLGTGNSQYGTCWIYSLNKKINKKIKKAELNSYLDEGWIKGRKMKF